MRVLGLGSTRSYHASSIRMLRAEVQPIDVEGTSISDPQLGGSIVFDYGEETIALAKWIDLAEAKHIVKVITVYDPSISVLSGAATSGKT